MIAKEITADMFAENKKQDWYWSYFSVLNSDDPTRSNN